MLVQQTFQALPTAPDESKIGGNSHTIRRTVEGPAQAENCEFVDNASLEDQVCDQLLVHIRDSKLWKKLLGESDLMLAKTLAMAHR